MFKAVPLYGACYLTGDTRKPLTHIVNVDLEPLQALCRRPKSDSLMDDATQWQEPTSATCKTCLRRYAKQYAHLAPSKL